MLTYQDFLEAGESDNRRMEFIRNAINTHKNSDAYAIAEVAQEYDHKQNRTIMNYQKLLYTISGQAVPDNYSANYKICSNFFNRFVTQQNQYLLGNGVSLNNEADKAKLGDDFDTKLQEAGRCALVDGISFGFWNYDHLEVFRLTEFVPLYDEENGALMAGIRFWQIDSAKPIRATLYELDGYTDYIWKTGEGQILRPKRKYVLSVRKSVMEGTEIYAGENYPAFPIVPLWGNPAHQSELVGLREQIDAYDLIKSGFANDLDDASQIYWTIQNAGGMDDVDLANFVKRMRTVKAAVMEDDGARAESHTLEVPFASREALLDRLRSDLYDDYMALDTKVIAGGATTATQILAAYEPLNSKADMYEYCILDFMNALFDVIGIEDREVTFTRSKIVNVQDEVQVLLQAGQYLSEDYITTKILSLLGDQDKAEDVIKDRIEGEAERFGFGEENVNDNGSGSEGDGQTA